MAAERRIHLRAHTSAAIGWTALMLVVLVVADRVTAPDCSTDCTLEGIDQVAAWLAVLVLWGAGVGLIWFIDWVLDAPRRVEIRPRA